MAEIARNNGLVGGGRRNAAGAISGSAVERLEHVVSSQRSVSLPAGAAGPLPLFGRGMDGLRAIQDLVPLGGDAAGGSGRPRDSASSVGMGAGLQAVQAIEDGPQAGGRPLASPNFSPNASFSGACNSFIFSLS